MKVKLKDGKMNKYNGLFRNQVKALNRGEVVEVDNIPLDAKPFLVEVGKESKQKTKTVKGEK
tara:strand:+ start:882 stop:1067 length:186 start_codon:yes stop_codon:yes gene_type:complete